MRILNITAQKPFDTGSGIYLWELAKGFDKKGHTQALLCGLSDFKELEALNSQNSFFEMIEACIFETPELDFKIPGMSDEMPYPSTKYKDMSMQMLQSFKNAFEQKIIKLIEEFKPDLIICHHLYILTALIVKTIKKIDNTIKIAGICHGTCLRQIASHNLDNQNTLEYLNELDVIFALHDPQLNEIKKLIKKPIFRVIGSGYNPLIFNQSDVDCNQTNWKNSDMSCNLDNEIKVIYAGKLSYKKGLVSLIKAMNLIDKDTLGNKKLALKLAGGAGSDEDMKIIQKHALKTSHRIEFLGKLDQHQLSAEFNRSDIFVLPSFYEGLPLVVIEALACNLPVVTSNTSGLKDWITKKAPHAKVTFVELPKMIDIDQPVEAELIYFEQDFAKAISLNIKELHENTFENLNLGELNNFSWIKICEDILITMG